MRKKRVLMKTVYSLHALTAMALVLSALVSAGEKNNENSSATKGQLSTNKSTIIPASDSIISPPAVIKSPSSRGEVSFAHEYHFAELEIECRTCHHETNAITLKFPHQNYFDDFWIDCKICHHETKIEAQPAQACSNCHHSLPANITDEALSSKVVIHKDCWKCHESGTGVEASEGCGWCHQGARSGQ